MTLRELFNGMVNFFENLFTNIIKFFLSLFDKLIKGEILELTIFQAIFIIVFLLVPLFYSVVFVVEKVDELILEYCERKNIKPNFLQGLFGFIGNALLVVGVILLFIYFVQ